MTNVEIETPRLYLRRFELKDKEELYNGFFNQKKFLYYANKEARTLEEIENYLTFLMNRYEKEFYFHWAICLKENNKIIGSINLKCLNENKDMQVGYAIDERYINKGYMAEAFKAVIDYSFIKLGVNSIQGGCVTNNIASKKVMEKCGLKYFKTEKEYMKLSDGEFDMDFYKIER